MPISPVKFVPREMKTTLIKVYSYENKLLQGSISNPFFDKELVFENVLQMITMLERISNSLLYPQKSMELRQFTESNLSEEKDAFDFVTTADFTDKFPIATFEIEIIFRQNASWQGNLLYADENLSSSFRSVLELLTLMDSVLTELK